MRRISLLAIALFLAVGAAQAQDPTKGAAPLTRAEIEKLLELRIDEARVVALVLIRGTRLGPGDLDALRTKVAPRVARAIEARGEGGVGPLKKGELEKLLALGIPAELVAKLIEARGSGLDAGEVAALGDGVPAPVKAALEARLAATTPPPRAGERLPIKSCATRTETILGKKFTLGVPEGWGYEFRPFDPATGRPATFALSPGADAVLGVYVLPVRNAPAEEKVKQQLVALLQGQKLTVLVDASRAVRTKEVWRAGWKSIEVAATGSDAQGRPVNAVASGFLDVPGWLVVALERAPAARFEDFQPYARLAVQLLAIEGAKRTSEWSAARPAVLAAPPAPGAPLDGLYWRSYWDGDSIEVEAFAFTRDGFVHEGLPDAARVLDPVREAAKRPGSVGTYSSEEGRVVLRFPGRKSPTTLRREGPRLFSDGDELRSVESDPGEVRLSGSYSASSYTSSSAPTFDGNGGQQTFSFSSRTTYVFTRDGKFESSGFAAMSFSRDHAPGSSGPWGEPTYRDGRVASDGKVRGTYAISRGRLVLTATTGEKRVRWFLAVPREKLKMILLDDTPFLLD